MHIESHIAGYQIAWLRRYLHPNRAPWKSVADLWLADPYPTHRGTILTNTKGNFYTDVPITAGYFRKCVKTFEKFKLTQNLNLTTPGSIGESVFFNHRFEVKISDEQATDWAKYGGLKRLHHTLNADTGEIFTEEEIKEWLYDQAPGGVHNTPAAHEFVDRLMRVWKKIVDAIPTEIIKLANTPPPLTPNTYLAYTMQNDTIVYVKVETNPDQSVPNEKFKFHIQWLDTFNTPHNTGKYLTQWQSIRYESTGVELWIDKHEDKTQNVDDIDTDSTPPTIYIMGPNTTTFPLCNGWSPAGTQNQDPKYHITNLTHLTIKRVTKFLTSLLTAKQRPNCEKNWDLHFPPNMITPWDLIWPSLGTLLSDAIEEKAWRKHLHRATNVRNRHKDEPDHSCRMCRVRTESMLHLTNCSIAKPFWDLVFKFITDTLKISPPSNRSRAIIFNEWGRNKIGPIEACAFIRHAFQHFIQDFVSIETNGTTFKPPHTFFRTITSFQHATIRYGQTLKAFRILRKYTTLKKHVPEETIKQFPQLITINAATYNHTLTPNFMKAIADAEETKKQFDDIHK
jgi:hypothetical protein